MFKGLKVNIIIFLSVFCMLDINCDGFFILVIFCF